MTTPAQPESTTPVESTPAEVLTGAAAGEFWEGNESAKADPFSDMPVDDPMADGSAPAPDAPVEAPLEVVAEPDPTPIPFKYAVDGQEKLFDGIEEVPGEGLLVSNDAIPRLRDAIQRGEHLAPQVQQMGREIERFQKVGGWQRIEQLEANSAVLQAIGTEFLAILSGADLDERGLPKRLAQLTENPEARAMMLEKLDIMTQRAEMTSRTAFGQQLQGFDRQGQETNARGNAITTAISTMGDAVAKMGMPVTAEDLAEATQVFGQFADSIYRAATAEEATALRIPVGSPIIDYPKLHPWFTARAQLRQRESAGRTTATAADAENARRLSATTPTRPASTRAALQRPGTGTKNAPRPDRPEITDWKTRMRMGLSPVADAPANP